MADLINDSKMPEISKTVVVDQIASTHDKTEQHQDNNEKRSRLRKLMETSACLIVSHIMAAILLSDIGDFDPRISTIFYGSARLVWSQIIPMFLIHALLFFGLEAGVELPYNLSSKWSAFINKFVSSSSSSSSTSKDATTGTERKEETQVPQNKRTVKGKFVIALPQKLKHFILAFRNVVLPDEDPTNSTTISQFLHLTIAIMRLIRQIKSLTEYNPSTFYMLISHSKNIFMTARASGISKKVKSSSLKKKTDDNNVPSSSSSGMTERFRRFLHAEVIPITWEAISIISLVNMMTASIYYEGSTYMNIIRVASLQLVFLGMEFITEEVLGISSTGTKIEEEITKEDITEEESTKEQEEDYVLVDAKEGEMDV